MTSGNGWYPLSGCHNSHEIERICGGNYLRSQFRLPAGAAQGLDGFRQPKLLSSKSCDETPAAYLPAELQQAIVNQQVAPRKCAGLPA